MTLGLIVMVAAIVFPSWLVQRARKKLTAEQLLLVERQSSPVFLSASLVLVPGALGYWLIGKYPAHGGMVFFVTVAVFFLALVVLSFTQNRRMKAAGAPATYVFAVSIAQWVGLVGFLVGTGIMAGATVGLV